MTTDPVIEAAARALGEAADLSWFWDDIGETTQVATAIVAAITPLIRAAALEQAAKMTENYPVLEARSIAARIRALKEQP